MVDIVIGMVILAILGAAIAYIVKEKKKGTKCIGCPASGCCSQKGNVTSGCSCGGK